METNTVSNIPLINEEFPPAVMVAARKEVQQQAPRKRTPKAREKEKERTEAGV